MTVKTDLLQLYNPLMSQQPLPALGNIGLLQPGQVLAAAATTTSSESVSVVTAPSWIVAGMNIWDVTAGAQIGTVASVSGSTITLSADAAHAIAAGDVLQLGLNPSDLTSAATVGFDLRGNVEKLQLSCQENIQLIQIILADVSLDSATTTLLNAVVTALS
jgi:hypothetical protein